MNEPPDILHWQQSFIDNVRGVLRWNYLANRPAIQVLDAGCDPTGKQLWHLAGMVCGSITGINITGGFPSREAVALLRSRPNARLLRMDATNMGFPDESFDLVISANVMEHVRNPERYIQECCRVLKKPGVAYFETNPIWTGPRGHHIHEDMIRNSCCTTEQYRNDGSIIPDWGHLVYDEQQMRDAVSGKLNAETVNWILDYIYHSRDLNRWGWLKIHRAFQSLFPVLELRAEPEPNAKPRLKPSDARENYDIAGFKLVARKIPLPGCRSLVIRFANSIRRRRRLLGLAVSRRLQPLTAC